MFVWRYLDAGGVEAGESDGFADREAAESWLGESWHELAERGIRAVLLIDRSTDATVYRMSLEEA